MAVSMRRAKRRRPIGTIAILTLLALGLAWVFVPLVRGEAIGSPMEALTRLIGGEVQAAGEDDGVVPLAEGKVRVIVSGRDIPAYQKVGRDDIWNNAKGTLAYSDLDEKLVESSGVIVDVREILGRVLAKPKTPGYAFSEKDFMPEGTRPGVAAGVPAGKRALRISVENVQGIVGLQAGDRFDMVGAFPLDDSANQGSIPFSGVFADQMNRRAKMNAYRRARVQVLVQNGVVVSPLETRLVPTSSASLTQGKTTRTLPVQEMVIALEPDEVAPFMEALSVEADITCLARSGRPDDPAESLTPSSEPTPPLWGASGTHSAAVSSGGADGFGPMTVIEVIDEEGRELVPVPRMLAGGSEPR